MDGRMDKVSNKAVAQNRGNVYTNCYFSIETLHNLEHYKQTSNGWTNG